MEPIATSDPQIILRPVTADDAPALFAVIERNRPRLAEWLPWATPDQTEEQLRQFLAERAEENHSRTALTTLIMVEGQIAGSIAMHLFDLFRRSTSIGYWLAEANQGRGVATTACRALIAEAFRNYNLHRIEIRCATGNARSAAIPLRLGFHEEGVLRQAEPLHGGFVDLRLFSLLSHEWLLAVQLLT